jgi:hypothetical protein
MTVVELPHLCPALEVSQRHRRWGGTMTFVPVLHAGGPLRVTITLSNNEPVQVTMLDACIVQVSWLIPQQK